MDILKNRLHNKEENVSYLKICGMHPKDDVSLFVDEVIEYVGLIFAESPRNVSLEEGIQCAKQLHAIDKKVVGVFADHSIEDVISYVEQCGCDVVQLHGKYTAGDIHICAQALPTCELWSVLFVGEEFHEIHKQHIDATQDVVTMYLFDTIGTSSGGNGVKFNPRCITQYTSYTTHPFGVAGGLRKEDIPFYLSYHPRCFDVNSSLEEYGRKSSVHILELVAMFRKYNRKIPSYFGAYGGQYVPESVMEALYELEHEAYEAFQDEEFLKQYKTYLSTYVGRPTALYYAENLSHFYGCKIYLKREDLAHTGAHKINNAIGQALLAKRMGKTAVIAETGAGQHGVATATAAAVLGLRCDVYMGSEDMRRQKMNVYRMRQLGANIHCVTTGLGTLKEATTAAIQAWTARVEDTFYILGSAVGPAPYPALVEYFQRVIGDELKQQLTISNETPLHLVACIGGGSNAIGMFAPFLDDPDVCLYGIEAGGRGSGFGMHASTLSEGKQGILHGMKTYVLQDETGNVAPVHSISAGLDYPGVGPKHAHLHDTKRVAYHSVTDREAYDALQHVTRTEGILPALESAHALAYLPYLCKTLESNAVVVVNISGRGDKDLEVLQQYEEEIK